ncbi:MAG: hypothetical protein HOC93_00300 [Phycisphaerae bacterium]|nr:hypothetical protein [Phycisphaerae bacterium]
MNAGSYLNWRKETAFGKEDQFSVSSTQKRRSIWSWARWAWMIRNH